jgi:protein-tyrosine phosphatase
MARYAVKDGIDAIVATPHALGSGFSNPPEKIRTAVRRLQEYLVRENIPLTLYAGAEIHLCPDMANRIIAGETVFLSENRRYILVEFPFHDVPAGFTKELFQLSVNGIIPILAHPERNPMIGHNPEILEELETMGCLVQVNSTSITGGFGGKIMMAAHQLIAKRVVHIVASDAHNLRHRPPALVHAFEIVANILKNKDEARYMVNEMPNRVITGL